MSARATPPPIHLLRHCRILVTAGHLIFALTLFSLTVIGLGTFPTNHPFIGGSASVLLVLCQLVLALGSPPARTSGALLAVIVCLSIGLIPLLGDGWLASLWFAAAAAGLVLRPLLAIATGVAMLSLWVGAELSHSAGHVPPSAQAVDVAYILVIFPFGAAALLSLAHLTALVATLEAERASAAAQAAQRERGRFSRDLHDLYGQSLSAMTLKSGLAQKLLQTDRLAAARQVEDLEQIALELEEESRVVAVGQRQATFLSEVGRADTLLHSVGVEATMDLRTHPTHAEADELFGWALREAITNVLRHSAATRCSVTLFSHDGRTYLRVDNDGVLAADGPDPQNGQNGQNGQDDRGGSGLLGLAHRARALGGRVEVSDPAADHFLLSVELPEVGP